MADSTLFVGPTNTYDLTVGIKIDMDPLIRLYGPDELPMQGGDPRLTLPSGPPATAKKIEWHDDSLKKPRGFLGAALTTTASVVTLRSGERAGFTTGDILLIDNEYIRVYDYGTTDDTLLVMGNDTTVRDSWSGTEINHASGAEVIVVGTALPEGSDPDDARTRDRHPMYNLTQIFGPYRIAATESDMAVAKYGIANEFDYQAMLLAKEQAIAFDQALVYGVRADDSGGKRRTMGGMTQYITTNLDATAQAYTETLQIDALQTLYGLGAMADTVMMAPSIKRKAGTFTSAGSIELQRSDSTRGVIVDVLETDFGTVRLCKNRYVRTKDVFTFERQQAMIRTLRPTTFQMLALTGDARNGMVVGEKTLEFVRERHAHRFSGITG